MNSAKEHLTTFRRPSHNYSSLLLVMTKNWQPMCGGAELARP